MKQALSQKDYIILNFQESCQKMESEIQLLNAEKEKLKNQNNKKEEMINKIKDKLDNQSKENEKLIMTHNNIKKSETYLKAKNKYEAKIQKLKKEKTIKKKKEIPKFDNKKKRKNVKRVLAIKICSIFILSILVHL